MRAGAHASFRVMNPIVRVLLSWELTKHALVKQVVKINSDDLKISDLRRPEREGDRLSLILPRVYQKFVGFLQIRAGKSGTSLLTSVFPCV